MEESKLPPLPSSNDEFWDGEKYNTELKSNNHEHSFIKINPNEIKCNCGVGFNGPNIDTLLKLFDKRK